MASRLPMGRIEQPNQRGRARRLIEQNSCGSCPCTSLSHSVQGSPERLGEQMEAYVSRVTVNHLPAPTLAHLRSQFGGCEKDLQVPSPFVSIGGQKSIIPVADDIVVFPHWTSHHRDFHRHGFEQFLASFSPIEVCVK